MIDRCKRGFSAMSTSNLLELSDQVVYEMSKNVEIFGSPSPSLELLESKKKAVKEAEEAVRIKADELKQARLARDTSKNILVENLSTLSSYVNNIADGDAEIILKSGFECRNTESGNTMLAKVENLQGTPGNDKGELALKWSVVKKVRSYEIEATTTFEDDSSWRVIGLSTKSSYLASNLESGKVMWFRVCAFGTQGKGAWCNPIQMIVP